MLEINTVQNNVGVTMKSKIKSIKKCKQRCDVYDIIGVEDNHNFIANGMVVHNCDLYGRGRGAIFMRDKNPVNDPWRLKDFKNVGSYNEFTSQAKIEEKLKKHPNFWSLIRFPKPSKAVYDKYLEVRESNVYNDAMVRASLGKEDMTRALLIMALRDIMKTDMNLDLKRIILHIKTEYDIHLSKPVVQSIIDDAAQLVTAMRDEEFNDDDQK